MHVIGTAGHVDHGKSSLVAALTGTNPDRWLEEQVRGMTLDLGFAHLVLDNGEEAGVVDVPGHERFLHNMLAGAAGMELLLLVVDAVEGVMPQTREHLAMLRYLNVRSVLVVISKIDLVAPSEREERIQSIRAELKDTLAQGAPAFGISALTREGLGELRAAIAGALASLPPRSVDAPAFLPVDRVFALPGHGTIVTGTLMQGRLRTGDRLQLAPHGTPVRIRSLQVFGNARESVDAGARVAVNLSGIETSDAERGDVLADAQFASASSLAVEFEAAAGASGHLRRRTPVRAYFGAAEILGTLVFAVPPQTSAAVPAVLHLRRAVSVFSHERFVLRRMSPKTLLGGGRVAGEMAAAAPELSPGGNVIAGVLAAAGLQPLTVAEAAARANVREDVAVSAITDLLETQRAVAVNKPLAYLDAAVAAALLERVRSALERRQAEQPWIAGTTSLALARELDTGEHVLIRCLAAFADDGRLAAHGGYYATPGYVPKLTPEQRAFFDVRIDGRAEPPFVPVPLHALLSAVKGSAVPGLGAAFDMLLHRGALVKVGDDVYAGAQIAAIRGLLEAFVLREKRITMAQFRDLTGTSRKYAVPLLEWFDARGVTVRSGDFRSLRTIRGS